MVDIANHTYNTDLSQGAVCLTTDDQLKVPMRLYCRSQQHKGVKNAESNEGG